MSEFISTFGIAGILFFFVASVMWFLMPFFVYGIWKSNKRIARALEQK